MPRRSAAGSGTIRKKTITKNGRKYTYWESRYTEGNDPGTGKQVQRSVYSSTQKEAARKLKDATIAIEDGTYTPPSDLTVSQWLDTWATTFLVKQKESTKEKYRADIKNHIKPGIGAVRLKDLRTETIQQFYNDLPLSDKTKRNIHGTLHKALKKAQQLGKIPFNPSDNCELKRPDPHEITPLIPEEFVRYVSAARDDQLGNMLIFCAFTGLRRNELIGLSWDAVDLREGCVTIKRQIRFFKGGQEIVPTKSSNTRTIYPAKTAMDALRAQKRLQLRWMEQNMDIWNNPYNFVFTDELGNFVSRNKLRLHHDTVLNAAGIPHHRLHDLRDTYAVTSLQAGDDIKTVQENLGHADAAFTLNVYLTSLNAMKKKSATNMESFFNKQNKSDKGKNKGNQKIG